MSDLKKNIGTRLKHNSSSNYIALHWRSTKLPKLQKEVFRNIIPKVRTCTLITLTLGEARILVWTLSRRIPFRLSFANWRIIFPSASIILNYCFSCNFLCSWNCKPMTKNREDMMFKSESLAIKMSNVYILY